MFQILDRFLICPGHLEKVTAATFYGSLDEEAQHQAM
jgi:hypothetical protein